MKKVKKILLLLIAVLIIVIVAAIRIYHYSILSKISKATESLESSVEPYFIKLTEIEPDGNIHIREYYRENDITVSRQTTKKDEEQVTESLSWSSLDEEFCNEYFANYENQQEDGKKIKTLVCAVESEERLKDDVNNIGFVNYYAYSLNQLEMEHDDIWLKIRNEINDTFFYPAVSSGEYKGRECYTLKPYGTHANLKIYVDKETFLTVAAERWSSTEDGVYFSEYEYLTEAPEGIYEKPNPEDFDEVSFMDSAENNIDSKIKLIAEKPISGTNLKPGEQLVENVEVKEDEELNFLKLTPNETGIINFEIYNLETYNKFREKYSNLRELTEEDFEAYYVAIAYKIGEKLNYLEQYESKETWKFNFVVNGEKSNKESLLLAIIPNESRNRSTIFVESDEKLKINAETAMNTANNSLTEIEEYFDLEFETYVGYTDDHLDLLTKEEFSKMEYIKTPISGKERICWNLHYKANNHETINSMDVYVDAITGEIIGAKNIYK